ncbi:MAG: InlB B-repeat-containing protein, partial [Dehalococcoidia bacterium]
MKESKKAVFFTALVLVAALFLGTVSAWADNGSRIRPLSAARAVLEHELVNLGDTGIVGVAHSETARELIVFVEDEDVMSRVPASVQGYPVSVEVTGRIEALGAQVGDAPVYISEDRRGEVSPLVGGTSLSAWIRRGPLTVRYAGTLGMVTYDNKILSNAHVIAKEPDTGDFLDIGTPLVQPGSGDGGTLADRVGELEAYIPIDFGSNGRNYADAAIGSIDTAVSVSPGEQLGEGGSYWIQGWTTVSKGDTVRKSGRTTGVTTGQVVHTNASVWVTYGDQSAYFVDQIVVSQTNGSFAAPGDSGSAVDRDGEFVGLLFAGSETHAVISKAVHIIRDLGIAVEPLEGWYSLSLSSTAGGSVTDPGEGMFLREAATVVELVAEADLHYRFVEWTGDVETVGDVYDAVTDVTMDSSYS